MFDIFKKKPTEVYHLYTYWDKEGRIPVIRKPPKKIVQMFRNASTEINENLLLTNYLRLKPDRFKDENIWISQKGKINIKLDVEQWDCGFWVSNDRFKEFSERENLGLEFFPVLVENKRRYLVSWRKLPTFWSYDLDLEENEYDEYWLKKWEPNYVFSSDVIQYYDWKMFCGSTHVSKYITWDIKRKMEKENFYLFSKKKMYSKSI